MVLSGSESRINGHAGCNNFFGSYRTDGETLEFSALGSTMMACPEGTDHEQAFLASLGGTNRYEISGDFLTLFRDDTELAYFEAVYL